MPAPSNVKEFPITWEKGLVTEVEESTLELGQASRLINWEPTAQGGLRARNAWSAISKNGLPTTYQVRGFGSIAVAGGATDVTAPAIVQKNVWPDGDADPAATRTATLTGCTIGNVLVVVVTDDSGETPTTTGGWTQRAVSTAERQYVKFYTKTVAASTEAFTYTITNFRIRSITLYEIDHLDSEDPGIKWAAESTFSGSGGSQVLSVTATDEDGGLAIVGTIYDGGTPDSAIGGTAGMTSVTQDNANTRVGVTFDDLDNIDFSGTGTGAGTQNYTSPSWTPHDAGVLLCIITYVNTGGVAVSHSVAGNGLTWVLQDQIFDGIGDYGYGVYSANLAAPGKSAGVITVSMPSLGNGSAFIVQFIRVVGGSTSDLIPQNITETFTGSAANNNQNAPNLGVALLSGSATIGVCFGAGTAPTVNADIGAGNWSAPPIDTSSQNMTIGIFAGDTLQSTVAYQSPGATDIGGGQWDWTGHDATGAGLILMEIAGSGNAAKTAHGEIPDDGTVTDQYTYIANKRITAKMVVWGFTPPAVQANPDQIDFYIVAALAVSATTYQIYRLLRDEITSGTWELIDTVTDATGNSSWVTFAQGAGALFWSASTLQNPRSITLNPLVAANITDLTDKSGRASAYHKDRMFCAGSESNPSRLFFSDIGLPTDFTTATDFLDIGGDDGEAIQDLVSVEGLLLVCKTNRLYLISGSGIETFFVNELPGGSAASGRAAVRTPYGTVVAGDDDIWVVQGGAVDPMSRPLGVGYEITGNVSTAYAQDSVLVADSGSGTVWRVNLVTGAWTIEEVSGSVANPVYDLFSLNGRLYYGVNGSTTQVGGTRRLSSSRTYDETTNGLRLAASTGRLALLGPSKRYTPRFLWLQLRSHDDTKENTLFLTIESDQASEPQAVDILSDTQRERLDLGRHKGAEWLKISFDGDGSSVAPAFDIEKTVIGMIVEDAR